LETKPITDANQQKIYENINFKGEVGELFAKQEQIKQMSKDFNLPDATDSTQIQAVSQKLQDKFDSTTDENEKTQITNFFNLVQTYYNEIAQSPLEQSGNQLTGGQDTLKYRISELAMDSAKIEVIYNFDFNENYRTFV
jgi:F0F1-type ATP synthase gamma subunit